MSNYAADVDAAEHTYDVHDTQASVCKARSRERGGAVGGQSAEERRKEGKQKTKKHLRLPEPLLHRK